MYIIHTCIIYYIFNISLHILCMHMLIVYTYYIKYDVLYILLNLYNYFFKYACLMPTYVVVLQFTI